MLIPVQAYERNPVGLFGLAEGFTTYQPGFLGQLENPGLDPTNSNTLPVVSHFDGDADTELVGLVDDSSTGVAGGYFGTSYTSVNTDGSVTGPATTAGSRRAGLWLQSGLFLTDQFEGETEDDGYGDLTDAIGSVMTVDTTTGKLGFNGIAGNYVAAPVRFLSYVNQNSDLLGSLVSPNQWGGPVTATKPMILIKFK